MSRAQQQTVFRVKEKNILSGIVKCQESIPIPQPHEVLVRIHAVSLNFRDYLPFSSKYPLPVKQDVVPGSDMAGEVLSIGSAVLGFKQGDRVLGYGVCSMKEREEAVDDVFGLPSKKDRQDVEEAEVGPELGHEVYRGAGGCGPSTRPSAREA